MLPTQCPCAVRLAAILENFSEDLVCSTHLLAPCTGLYTASLVSLTDVLIGWRAPNYEVPIRLLRIQINTGNTAPSPTWRASPMWHKQKAFPLLGTVALWVFWKARNSLLFSEAADSPMLTDMGRETVYRGSILALFFWGRAVKAYDNFSRNLAWLSRTIFLKFCQTPRKLFMLYQTEIHFFTTFSNFKHGYIKKFYWSSHIFHWSFHFFISRGPRTDKFRGVWFCPTDLSPRISIVMK